jgi:hypothetical protein
MRSASWLRRLALALALLGLFHLAMAWPVYRMLWKSLPLETALASLYGYLATGLWIAGSGLVLGFLAEAAKSGEEWSGPFARGVANLLVAGGVLGCALVWTDPVSWGLLLLALAARRCAGVGEPTPPAS